MRDTTLLRRPGADDTYARLGPLLQTHGISVLKLARVVKVARQTLYNWIKGGSVQAHYRPTVERLMTALESDKNSTTVWANVIAAFSETK